LLDQLEPGSAASHLFYILCIGAPLNEEALGRSLNALITRQEILRPAALTATGKQQKACCARLPPPAEGCLPGTSGRRGWRRRC
jgi:hypothetical protein